MKSVKSATVPQILTHQGLMKHATSDNHNANYFMFKVTLPSCTTNLGSIKPPLHSKKKIYIELLIHKNNYSS